MILSVPGGKSPPCENAYSEQWSNIITCKHVDEAGPHDEHGVRRQSNLLALAAAHTVSPRLSFLLKTECASLCRRKKAGQRESSL